MNEAERQRRILEEPPHKTNSTPTLSKLWLQVTIHLRFCLSSLKLKF